MLHSSHFDVFFFKLTFVEHNVSLRIKL